MSISDQMAKLGKRMDDALDGVLAEQIGTNSRIDDLDHQLGDVRDLLLKVISLLEPAADAGGATRPRGKR